MKINYKIITLTLVIFASAYSGSAQDVQSDTVDYMSMELEQLMNIKIVSASKKSEDLFEAPLSASVLTKDEIKRAGCTSIMEAFKLMPGVIVREQSNGNYDVHVRGLDGIPRNNVFNNFANNTTLVMIDNRPVYNYYEGGTFWETLPIDLNDVERIEIIRGPASAMYGPNAATGVINIITRTPNKTGLYAVANSQVGTNNTKIGNASLGYKFNKKLNVIMSGNFQQRDRHDHQKDYYSVLSDSYVPADSLKVQAGPFIVPLQNIKDKYPNVSRSMNRNGFNSFINYTPMQGVSFNLAGGLEKSEVQKVFGFIDGGTLSTASSNTRYADFKASVKKVLLQLSFNGGTQAPAVGYVNQKYDFHTFDGTLEYDFNFKNLSIKPGINYRSAVYDDSKYVNVAIREGTFNGSKSLTNKAAFIRGDYKILNEKIRLIAGLRVDEFNHPDNPYLSHQLALNYTISKKHIFRITQSRAFRSPFMVDTYLDINTIIIHAGPNIIHPVIQGNPDLKLVTVDMIELGYRGKLADNFHVDVEVFDIRSKNYAYTIEGAPTTNTENSVTTITLPSKIQNLPTVAEQMGATVSLNFTTHNFQFKPFVTYQYTALKKYSDYRNYAEAAPGESNKYDPAKHNINTTNTVKHTATPSVYGGAFINYNYASKLNINLNPYYLGRQQFLYVDNLTYHDDKRGVDNIAAKFTMNAKVSYTIIKPLAIFISARNLFNNNTREFYKSDNIGATYLAGINFHL